MLEVYVGLLAAVILLIATNAALIGLSRLTFSMGVHRQLPEVLRQVHPRFKTPYVAIVVFTAVAALVMAPGQTKFLGAIYAFGATLSFTVAHVSVIRLRKLRPLRERPPDRDGNPPWSPRGNFRLGGIEIPITAVLGGLGTFGAFVVAMVLDPVILATGGGWMAGGALLYVIYRRNQGLPLTQTVKVSTLEPLGVEEVEYRSVLLVFEQGTFSDEVVAIAKALAAPRRQAIHVVALVEVPAHTELRADVPQDAEAQSVIERAKLICGGRVTGHIEHVRPGQAGAVIVGEAKGIEAAVIVMPLRYVNGEPVMSRALRTVLAERPARVIVDARPGGADGGRLGFAAPTRT